MTRNAADMSVKNALCVDLDGTLIHTDLTLESLLAALKLPPWLVLLLPWWLLKGRSHMKHQLVQHAQIDVSVLPYCSEVIELIRSARQANRHTVLVTGSHEILARQRAEHLPVFDTVLATTANHMDEDPIFFAVKDPETWTTSLAIAGILFAASMLSL